MSSTSDKEIIANLPKLDRDIIDQVEHYFSEANIRRDPFMQRMIRENKGGWFTMSIMLKFRQLAKITRDTRAIVAAIEKSPHGIIQVSDDKTKIRRHPDKPVTF